MQYQKTIYRTSQIFSLLRMRRWIQSDPICHIWKLKEKKKKKLNYWCYKERQKKRRNCYWPQFYLPHLHRAKQFSDVATNTKEGNVDVVDALGGEFFNSRSVYLLIKACTERGEVVSRKLKNEIRCKFENRWGIAVGIGSDFKENKLIKRK